HAARRGRGPARTREADIVIVSTMNLRGGTTAANAAEILAYRAAGLRVGLVHHPVLDRAMGRPVDPRIRALTDGEQVFEVRPHDTVRCDLAIARFPAALANLMEDRPRIEAARTVLLVNQTPFEQYGPTGGYGTAWSIGDVHRNTTEWLGPHTWYAIGPAVRDAMRDHHADELASVEQSEDFWYETIDTAEWTPRSRRVRAEGEPIRIGRHSRDHITKFPNMAKRLRAAYPSAEDIEVHTLGGNEALRRILGSIPERWVAHPFGAMPVVDFLGGVDVYVYFIDDALVEAFGRAPLEAMAAGVPCVLPPKFAELFGDGALYCEPDGVEAQVRRLMADPEHYAERVRAGLRVVHERFSPRPCCGGWADWASPSKRPRPSPRPAPEAPDESAVPIHRPRRRRGRGGRLHLRSARAPRVGGAGLRRPRGARLPGRGPPGRRRAAAAAPRHHREGDRRGPARRPGPDRPAHPGGDRGRSEDRAGP